MSTSILVAFTNARNPPVMLFDNSYSQTPLIALRGNRACRVLFCLPKVGFCLVAKM